MYSLRAPRGAVGSTEVWAVNKRVIEVATKREVTKGSPPARLALAPDGNGTEEEAHSTPLQGGRKVMEEATIIFPWLVPALILVLIILLAYAYKHPT